MEQKSKYVSPEYQEQLDNLAQLLVTERRFGQVILAKVIPFPNQLSFDEIPDNAA